MIIILFCLILNCFSALAEPVKLSPVIIKSNRIKAKKTKQIAISTTHISSEDLKIRQTSFLTDILRTVPGVMLVQLGGKGHLTSLFIRGTNNHVQVRIDGMRSNNPGSANGSFDFANFTIDGFQTIDVHRGPMSSLFGPDALGGVIQIKTEKGKGTPTLEGTVEGGSQHAYRLGGKIQGAYKQANFLLSASQNYTRGIIVTPIRIQTPDAVQSTDPYRQYHINGRFGVDFTDDLSVSFFSRAIKSNLGYKSFQESMLQQTNSYLNRLQMNGNFFDKKWMQELSVSFIDLYQGDQFIETKKNSGYSIGKRWQLDWHNIIKMTETLEAQLMLSHEKERMTFSSSNQRSQSFLETTGFAWHQKWLPIDELAFEGSMRFDRTTRYSIPITYRFGMEISPVKGGNLWGSFGTAYKTPTLYQLYVDLPFFQANPLLKPESCKGWEAGGRYQWKNIQIGAVYFCNNLHDLIAVNESFTTMINIDSAHTQGVESFIHVKIADHTVVKVSHTLLEALNRSTKLQLLRRPRHKLTLEGIYHVTENWDLIGDIMLIGRRRDFDRKMYQPITKGSYALVNIRSSYTINPKLQVFGRIENLLNRRYEDPSGYNQPQLSFYIGLKGKIE